MVDILDSSILDFQEAEVVEYMEMGALEPHGELDDNSFART